jgi:isopenicillin N synthase-like dioxygenase
MSIGFFFIVNHGVSWPLVEEVFGEARSFHAARSRQAPAHDEQEQEPP